MRLPNGLYRTSAGSTLTVAGDHGGMFTVSFDWLEESGACSDCRVDPAPDEGRMVWSCAQCGGGSAELFPLVTPKQEQP